MYVFIKLLICLFALKYVKSQNSEECGQKRFEDHPHIVSGTNVAASAYPWHIGIYSSEKRYMCGGSILSQKVILSAAHCFTNFEGNVKPKENYLIAAGKLYNSYDDPRDEKAQYATIASIHIPESYKGATTNFEFDIAVIILTNALEFSESVQPVCLDLNNVFENEQLVHNNHGLVTGWNYRKEYEDPSDELKELSLPYVPFGQCFEEVSTDFRRYLTSDKICAGYLDNSTDLCGGDSGAPMVFARKSNDRYYQRAIVSVSLSPNSGRCGTQFGAYTSVSQHLEFIKTLLSLNKV